MTVYPYKQLAAGKFTKWKISVAENGAVLVEQYFKGNRKRQELFLNVRSIKESDLPKNVKRAAEWAKYDASGMGLGG